MYMSFSDHLYKIKNQKYILHSLYIISNQIYISSCFSTNLYFNVNLFFHSLKKSSKEKVINSYSMSVFYFFNILTIIFLITCIYSNSFYERQKI